MEFWFCRTSNTISTTPPPRKQKKKEQCHGKTINEGKWLFSNTDKWLAYTTLMVAMACSLNPLHQIGTSLLVPTSWDGQTIRFFLKMTKCIWNCCNMCKIAKWFFYRWMKPNYLTLLASVVNRIQPECPTFTFFRPSIGSLNDMRVPNFCIKAK